MGLAKVGVDVMAGAAALADDVAEVDADPGGVGDTPAGAVAAAEGAFSLRNLLHGDGFALPAVKAKNAVHLGDSLPTLKAGHLDAYRVPNAGREVLLQTEPPGLPSLREMVQGLTQYRPGSLLWQQHRRRAAAPLADLSDAELGAYTDRVMAGLDAALPELVAAPNWELVAELANASLDCSAWGPPPWSSDQWATLAVVLELAQGGDG